MSLRDNGCREDSSLGPNTFERFHREWYVSPCWRTQRGGRANVVAMIATAAGTTTIAIA